MLKQMREHESEKQQHRTFSFGKKVVENCKQQVSKRCVM